MGGGRPLGSIDWPLQTMQVTGGEVNRFRSLPRQRTSMVAFLLNSILGGVLATLFMDIAGTLVRVIGLTAGAPPSTIGKWSTYLFQGRLITATSWHRPRSRFACR